MGLDIYMYKAEEDLEPWHEKQREYERISNKNWKDAGGYDKITEKKRDEVSALNKKVADSLGLDGYGGIPSSVMECISMPSEKHGKDHLFQIGYFRSSYNNGGINSQCDRLGIPSLYDIFADYEYSCEDDYYRQINWLAARDMITDTLKQLRELVGTDRAKFEAMDINVILKEMLMEGSGISPNKGKPDAWYQEKIKRPVQYEEHVPVSAPDAMDKFMVQYESHKNDDGEVKGFTSYTSREGHFYLEGRSCYGFIPGVAKHWSGGTVPTMYVITDSDSVPWVLSAMEIVEETIDYALAEGDSADFVLGWSG